ncbi:class I SAM-dependent methyltransferase [Verrucomicrobiota bacterium]
MEQNQEDIRSNIRKRKLLEKTLLPYIKSGLKVLDVGAGEGWAMSYFQEKSCEYYAVEPVERLAYSIKDRGGKVIGRNIFDNLQEYKGCFDIIIFRHVLEHLLDPCRALEALAEFLRPEGILYVALPNAVAPSVKKGFRSSYIRPVHISYFCVENVLWLASRANLGCVEFVSEGEICCLFSLNAQSVACLMSCVDRQRKIFNDFAKRAYFKDINKLTREIAMTMIQRLAFKRLLTL